MTDNTHNAPSRVAKARAFRASLDRGGRHMFDDYATMHAHRPEPIDEINMAELWPGYGREVVEMARAWRPIAIWRERAELAAAVLLVACVLGLIAYGMA